MRQLIAILLSLFASTALAQPYWGNFPDGGTLYFYTNTVGQDGAGETPASEAIAVYKDGSATQLTTGATIDDDFDSVTGFHQIAIDTTQTSFDAGSLYTIQYTAGTSDSVSLIGRTIGSFYLGPKDANVTTFASGAIDATAIAANAIGASEVADDAIDAGAIATDAIGAAELAANSITSSEVADDSIDAGAIAADAIGNSESAMNGSELTVELDASQGPVTFTGAAASGGTPATAGLTLVGGAASTTGGGVASPGFVVTGGAGAASTNGAAGGATFTGGGTNTVSSVASGLSLVATSTGSGLSASGSTTGHGANFESGNLSGASGINATSSAATVGYGIQATGSNAGAGLRAKGGATGPGIRGTGGDTSGDGISIATTDGDGITIAATGASQHGVQITAGASGTADALKLTASSGSTINAATYTGDLKTAVDAIKTVTDMFTAVQAEPTGAPAANETPLEKLGFLFATMRNKVTVTATEKTVYDDADAEQWDKELSDNGTTYTETEAAAAD